MLLGKVVKMFYYWGGQAIIRLLLWSPGSIIDDIIDSVKATF
jgi:hypothetical protein